MAALKTNYQDDILDVSSNPRRKYKMINNADSSVSFEDISDYTQEGTLFGANDINATNMQVNANTNALGGVSISYDQSTGHFYASKGGIIKKLGSSDGTATTSQVLAGATFNSTNTPDNADYSTGTMPNKGAWISATFGKGNIAIPEGYHNGRGYVNGQGAYDAGVTYADGRVNNDSASYKKGVADADGRVNTASVNYKTGYSNGVTDADNRANADSVNYKTGYNNGVTFADGRSNPNSVNYKTGYNNGINSVSFISISSSSASYGNYANCRKITFPAGTKQAIVWSYFKERYDGHTGWQPTIVTSGNCTYNKVGNNFDYTLYPDDNLDRIGVGTYLVNITDKTQSAYVIFKESNSASGYYII